MGAGRELFKSKLLSVQKLKGKNIKLSEEFGVIPSRNETRNRLQSQGGSNRRNISLEKGLTCLLSSMASFFAKA